MKTEQWVLEWNKDTNFFHVQPLSQSLASAQECFMKDRQVKWSILMVGSYDVVTNMADAQRHRLEERSKVAA